MIIDGEHVRHEYDRLIEMSHFMAETDRRSLTGVLHVLAWVMAPDYNVSPSDILKVYLEAEGASEADEKSSVH